MVLVSVPRRSGLTPTTATSGAAHAEYPCRRGAQARSWPPTSSSMTPSTDGGFRAFVAVCRVSDFDTFSDENAGYQLACCAQAVCQFPCHDSRTIRNSPSVQRARSIRTATDPRRHSLRPTIPRRSRPGGLSTCRVRSTTPHGSSRTASCSTHPETRRTAARRTAARLTTRTRASSTETSAIAARATSAGRCPRRRTCRTAACSARVGCMKTVGGRGGCRFTSLIRHVIRRILAVVEVERKQLTRYSVTRTARPLLAIYRSYPAATIERRSHASHSASVVRTLCSLLSTYSIRLEDHRTTSYQRDE